MLTPAECQIIIDTLMPFEPSYIGIFGSVARGDDTPESDVDIISSFNYPQMSLFDLGGIYEDLKDGLHRKVDVTIERSAPKWLIEDLTNDVIIIYGQKDFTKVA
jgi:uncharacterized protein